jgi:NADH-quinone oxidoreductase subunit E
MLTSAETTEIMEELGHYEHKQAASVEALLVVQRHRGWVPDDALQSVAGLLDMTPEELDSVATFYNLIFRRPVGRHVILICDTVSCWVMGYEAIVERLGERLGITFGQTTADGRFTLLPIPCLGACDRAPAMMIDDDLYGPVQAETLDEILARYP